MARARARTRRRSLTVPCLVQSSLGPDLLERLRAGAVAADPHPVGGVGRDPGHTERPGLGPGGEDPAELRPLAMRGIAGPVGALSRCSASAAGAQASGHDPGDGSREPHPRQDHFGRLTALLRVPSGQAPAAREIAAARPRRIRKRLRATCPGGRTRTSGRARARRSRSRLRSRFSARRLRHACWTTANADWLGAHVALPAAVRPESQISANGKRPVFAAFASRLALDRAFATGEPAESRRQRVGGQDRRGGAALALDADRSCRRAPWRRLTAARIVACRRRSHRASRPGLRRRRQSHRGGPWPPPAAPSRRRHRVAGRRRAGGPPRTLTATARSAAWTTGAARTTGAAGTAEAACRRRSAGREGRARCVPDRLDGPGDRSGQQRGHHDGEDRRPYPRSQRAREQASARGAGHDHQRYRPRERAGDRSKHDQLGHDPRADDQRGKDPGAAQSDRPTESARQDQAGARAQQRRRERRQERDVVRMKDPAGEAEHDGRRQECPADRDQPAGSAVAPSQPREREQREPSGEREAEQPARLVAEAGLEEPERPGRAAEQDSPTSSATASAGRGAAGLARDPAEAVVTEDQRPDAVV